MISRFEKFTLALFALNKCWHKLTFSEMEKLGLKGPHAVYLLALYKSEEGLTTPEICKFCEKDKSDAHRMLGIMEEKGFVKKEKVNSSRYRGVYKLTENGRECARKVCERIMYVVDFAGKELSEEKRAIFYEAMESVATNLKTLIKEGFNE